MTEFTALNLSGIIDLSGNEVKKNKERKKPERIWVFMFLFFTLIFVTEMLN